MKKFNIENREFIKTDFIIEKFSKAEYENCDLSRAIFANTILEKADFTSSYNYSIDSEIN